MNKTDTKILIVDDQTTARKILMRFLSHLGFRNCIESQSGKDALGHLDQNAFDIIFCDLNLGDMKGIDVLDAIRRSKRHKNTPFIMVTSDMKKSEFIDAVNRGVTDYILKPLNENTIEEKIHSALSKTK